MDRWTDQLEELARQTLPGPVHEHVRQGAHEGLTTMEAVEAWQRFRFLPAVLRDVTEVDCTTELLGTPVRSPFAIAPTTLQRAAHPDGELAMARAARTSDALMVVCGDGGTTFEEVGRTGVDWWVQLYLPSDRPACTPLLDRAIAAGASAVVLTVDAPAVATGDWVEPGWLGANTSIADDEPAEPVHALDLGPQDIVWLRAATGLPVVVKGILRPGDARRCVDAGASAVWVSNHGGRSFDGASATADCVGAVVAEVGQAAEVYVDGGVRTGRHALAALALGARAVFLGRPPLYALAVDGEHGVARLLAGLTDQLLEAMRLAGCHDLGVVDAGLLSPR